MQVSASANYHFVSEITFPLKFCWERISRKQPRMSDGREEEALSWRYLELGLHLFWVKVQWDFKPWLVSMFTLPHKRMLTLQKLIRQLINTSVLNESSGSEFLRQPFFTSLIKWFLLRLVISCSLHALHTSIPSLLNSTSLLLAHWSQWFWRGLRLKGFPWQGVEPGQA